MDRNRIASLRHKMTERLTSSAQYRSTLRASCVFKDKALIEITLLPLSRPKPLDGPVCTPRQTLLSCFLQLPPELQLEILSYLDYGEIQRLRRTNRLFRRSINARVIKNLFPDLEQNMLSTCYICLTQKGANAVVRGDYAHPRYPMASRCFECIARRSGFMVGQRYTLANLESVWVCRWCGNPVTAVTGWNQHEFHVVCYQKYKGVLATHFGIGALQWMVVIAGSALCWHYFRHEEIIVAPTVVSGTLFSLSSRFESMMARFARRCRSITAVGEKKEKLNVNGQVNFVMSFWVCLLGMLRGPKMRTFHWSLLIEFLILTLWIPPLYAIIDKAIIRRENSSLHVPPQVTTITLVLIALNT